jgi:hypothetical protein
VTDSLAAKGGTTCTICPAKYSADSKKACIYTARQGTTCHRRVRTHRAHALGVERGSS